MHSISPIFLHLTNQSQRFLMKEFSTKYIYLHFPTHRKYFIENLVGDIENCIPSLDWLESREY